MKNSGISYVVDESGAIQAVQIASELWKKIEPFVGQYVKPSDDCLVQKEGPLNDFKTLMEYWDFRYPYSPRVECPNCGAQTDDWQKKDDNTFVLTNANLGGLLVFHCKKCGTTIRQKHFYDHVSYEHTVPH